MTSSVFAMYALGMAGFCVLDLINKAYYTMHKTLTPLLINAVVLVLNIVLNLVFRRSQSCGLIARTTAVSLTVGGVIALICFFRDTRGSLRTGKLLKKPRRRRADRHGDVGVREPAVPAGTEQAPDPAGILRARPDRHRAVRRHLLAAARAGGAADDRAKIQKACVIMKQHLHSYRLLLIAAAICTLAAFWLLGARIGVEQTQRQVDVVISYEDTVRLADASGVPVQEWLTQLADAGVRELLVTPDEQAEPDIVRAAQDTGLTLAQAGGLAQGGTYFFAAQYDTLATAGQTGVDIDTEPLPQAQVLDALRESGSTLVLIEDKNQTGCVLPDGYTLDGYTGGMVKGFWLNQTFRARYQTLGYSGAEEIVNMLFTARLWTAA